MFFLAQLVVVLAGSLIHIFLDRKPDRRTSRRVVELFLVWLIAAGGCMAVLAGLAHIGPNSGTVADGIGYTPSMFQWEIGWADIAIGVVGLGCIWKRDAWLTCAVTVLTISYWGDAIGHVMQYIAHDNAAPENVWAIPSDVVQPLLAVGLLLAYRSLPHGRSAHGEALPEPEQPTISPAKSLGAKAA